jgi:hypothetical protein
LEPILSGPLRWAFAWRKTLAGGCARSLTSIHSASEWRVGSALDEFPVFLKWLKAWAEPAATVCATTSLGRLLD